MRSKFSVSSQEGAKKKKKKAKMLGTNKDLIDYNDWTDSV